MNALERIGRTIGIGHDDDRAHAAAGGSAFARTFALEEVPLQFGFPTTEDAAFLAMMPPGNPNGICVPSQVRFSDEWARPDQVGVLMRVTALLPTIDVWVAICERMDTGEIVYAGASTLQPA